MDNEIFLQLVAHNDHASARRQDGRSAVLPFHAVLEASKVFSASTTALRVAATLLAAAAPNMLPNLTARGWTAEFSARHAASTLRAARDLRNAAVSQTAELAKWRADMLKPAVTLDPATASETRAWLRSLKPGEATKAVLTQPAVSAAALGAWHLTNLHASMRPQVEDALLRHNLTERYSSTFSSKPDAANPFATGPDRETAENAAVEGLANQEAARVELETAKTLFGNAVDFIAIVGDVSRDDAFNMITAAT